MFLIGAMSRESPYREGLHEKTDYLIKEIIIVVVVAVAVTGASCRCGITGLALAVEDNASPGLPLFIARDAIENFDNLGFCNLSGNLTTSY